MPKLSTAPRTGRYSYDDAAYEVQRWAAVERGRKKRIAIALALDPTLIAPRLRGKKSRFSLEQFGVIADEAAAPVGWPFMQWEKAARADPAFHGLSELPWPLRVKTHGG